jgi:superfamily II DNA/RNA helicase
VNYSIPRELDNYVHRIGRTARSGKQGLALSFVTFSHRELIGRIERMTKSRMKEGVIPSHKDIVLKRINKVRSAFENRGPQGRATAMLPEEWKAALAELSQADIAGRFLSLLIPDVFEDKKAPERLQDSRSDAAVREPREQRSSREPRREEGRFRPKFADKKNFQSRKSSFGRSPSWDRGDKSRSEGEYSSSGREFAPKPRWKKNFAKPSPSLHASPAEGFIKPKKKKPYGHWKSKKEKPAPTIT